MQTLHLSVFELTIMSCCLQVDVFLMDMTSLGALQRLVIGHNGVGHGAGWFLSKVTVRQLSDGDAGKKYVFPCDRWLDDHEDDGRTERELLVAGK